MMQRNGMLECSNCHKLLAQSPRTISRAYDKHRSKVSSKARALKTLLVVGDCILVGLQVRRCFILCLFFNMIFVLLNVNLIIEVDINKKSVVDFLLHASLLAWYLISEKKIQNEVLWVFYLNRIIQSFLCNKLVYILE